MTFQILRSPALPWVLGLAFALVIGPHIVAADDDKDRPDLKIEFGNVSPGNDQLITFKVTNIGKGKSTAIKAHIFVREPEPTPWVRDVDVPSLASKASAVVLFPLAASCSGHVVRAEVNDPLDKLPGNNFTELQVCPPKAPSSGPAGLPSDGTVLGRSTAPDATDSGAVLSTTLKPEHLLPGDHVWEEPATYFRWRRDGLDQGLFGTCTFSALWADVGFNFYDGPGCNTTYVFQYVAFFENLGWLQAVEKKFVSRVELLYDEEIGRAQEPDGDDVTNDVIAKGQSCIGRVGFTSNDYKSEVDNEEFITSEPLDSPRLKGGWEVTKEIQYALIPGAEWNGFTFHPRSQNLDAENNGSCYSWLHNVRLRIFYSVL